MPGGAPYSLGFSLWDPNVRPPGRGFWETSNFQKPPVWAQGALATERGGTATFRPLTFGGAPVFVPPHSERLPPALTWRGPADWH